MQYNQTFRHDYQALDRGVCFLNRNYAQPKLVQVFCRTNRCH